MTALLLNPFATFHDQLGHPLDQGYIYVGQPNKDPRQFPISVYLDSAKTNLAIQPLRTTKGTLNNGTKPIPVFTNENNYSLLVLDKDQAQVFYDKSIITSIFDFTNALDQISQIADDANLTAQQKFDQIQDIIDQTEAVADQLAASQQERIDQMVNAGLVGAGSTDLLLVATNNKNQRFINTQWLDFTPFASSNMVTNVSAMNSLIAQAKATNRGIRCAPCGVLYFNDNLDFTGVKYIDFRTDIIMQSNKMVTVGGFADTSPICDIAFYSVTNGTSVISAAPPVTPVVRVTGLKNSKFTVGNCNYLQFYSDQADVTKASTAYNDIGLYGAVSKFEITDSGAVNGSGLGGWVNENNVWGGRIQRLIINGISYTHNHNKFYNNTFEGDFVEIRMARTQTNQIFGARFEDVASAPGVFFAVDAAQNTIEQTWSGSGSTRTQFSFSPTVSDLGQGNHCTSLSASNFARSELFAVQGNGLVSDGTTTTSQSSAFGAIKEPLATVANFTPGLTGFSLTSNRLIALTGLVAVKLGDAVKFDGDYDGSLLRPRIWCYDENQKLITDVTAGPLILLNSASFSNNSYISTANLDVLNFNRGFSIERADVKYIQVGCYSSTTGIVRSVSAYLYTQNLGRGKAIASATQRIKLPQLANDVTQGFVPSGYEIYNSTFKSRNHVIFAFETRLTVAVATSATSITIDSATGIKNGDIVGIQLDSGLTHWSKVSGLSGTTHIVDALPSAAAINARVVYNRWAVTNYSAVLNAASYISGTTELTYTITGVTETQRATVRLSRSVKNLIITADVISADTVKVYIFNPAAASIAVAGGLILISIE